MKSVSDAVAERWSCRAFKSDAVDEEQLHTLLGKALQAPSGGNVQPWRMVVLTGEAKDAVTPVVQGALFQNPKGEEGDYPVYPSGLQEPFRSRRFKVGEDLYASLDVPREDKQARFAWLAKNFEWFGAPVGIFFITQKNFGHGQFAHMGMLMQTIALLADEAGLATCMQEAWGMARETLHTHLGLDENEVVYCGMALGHPDREAPVNSWRSDRAGLEEVVDFRGF